jgi:hypothetical protein
MISSVGIVAPLVLPNPNGYNTVQADVAVTAAADPNAVEVTVPQDAISLATIIVPQQAMVSYLPAHRQLTGDPKAPWPVPAGPFDQDAWVIDAVGETSPLAQLLPPGIPVPAYWVLECVDIDSVDDPRSDEGLLDGWLKGLTPGVQPQVQVCHDKTDPADQADSPVGTWKKRMLNGTWAERLPAETALGLASLDGTRRRLRIWAFDADGTPLPAAAILGAFDAVDPTLLPSHPVVTGCSGVAATMPVRFHLRFDIWDVDRSSAEDPKGGVRSIPPTTVQLIDAVSLTPVPNTAWTPGASDAGVLEVPSADVHSKAFTIQATFILTAPLRLTRTDQRSLSVGFKLPSWSSAGRTGQDGTTGDWTNFRGVLVGTAAQPVGFWVGTKVRLAAKFEQPRINWFDRAKCLNDKSTYTIRHVDMHGVAAGHTISLFQGTANSVNDYVTDDDGEVSGVDLAVAVSTPVTIGLYLRLSILDLNGGANNTRIEAAEDAAKSLPPDMLFQAGNARIPLSFPNPGKGGLSASIGPMIFTVDANVNDFTRGNTVCAAALHALKCAKLTHDAVALLQNSSAGLPPLHAVVPQPAGSEGPSTTRTIDKKTGSPLCATYLPADTAWFCTNVVCHEYSHAIIWWLGGVMANGATITRYGEAVDATVDREKVEKKVGGHSAGLITNSGVALDEGLAEFIESLLGYYPDYHGGRTTLGVNPNVTSGDPKDRYTAQEPGGYPRYLYTLDPETVRGVEAVVAMAISDYLIDVTGFRGFLIDTDSVPSRQRPAKEYYDQWGAAFDPDDLWLIQDRLRRLFRWLVTDTVGVLYGNPAKWTGRWLISPAPGSPTTPVPYPTVEDYLAQLKSKGPDSGPTHDNRESFGYLHRKYLARWNLE